LNKKQSLRKTMRTLMLAGIAAVMLLSAALTLPACSEESAAATGITTAAGFVGVYVCFLVVAWLAGLFFFVVWIIMIVDCAKRGSMDFPDANQNSKLMWILIIVLAGSIGAIIYYFLVMRKMPRKKQLQQ